MHLVRMWHTRALENFAGPFRSGHPLAWGWEGFRPLAPRSGREARRGLGRGAERCQATISWTAARASLAARSWSSGGRLEGIAAVHVNWSDTRLARVTKTMAKRCSAQPAMAFRPSYRGMSQHFDLHLRTNLSKLASKAHKLCVWMAS